MNTQTCAADAVADKLRREGASPNTVKQYRARIAGFLASPMEALEYIGEVHIDTEAGELVTVDWDGERSTWNLAAHGVTTAIAVSWDEVGR